MNPQPLAYLLESINARSVVAKAGDAQVTGVTIDSRKVGAGSVFVACRGATEGSADGHDYLTQAASQGAVAVVVEDTEPASALEGVDVYVVADSRLAAAQLAERFYEAPSSALAVVGITGTNGKTTVSFLVADVLAAAGRSAAVLGTLGVGRRGALRSLGFTTPEAEVLSREVRALADDGVTHVAMEVSSHALATERVGALDVAVAAFTNLSRDHLDLHKTMEAYFAAKQRLFTERRRAEGAAVLPDGDGPWERELRDSVQDEVILYGHKPSSAVSLRSVTLSASGMRLELTVDGVAGVVESPLVGAPNVENLLCAAGCALGCGLTPAEVLAALPAARPVPGRFEAVPGAGGARPSVIVDYAHTPDALRRALATCREVADGRVLVVFGCGGDRDPGKRPLMGQAAVDGADIVIVTDDNPRTENPAAITDAIVGGLEAGSCSVVRDRGAAIAQALAQAQAGDVVLIAGKGHESTQTVGADVLPFSDVAEAQRLLEAAS